MRRDVDVLRSVETEFYLHSWEKYAKRVLGPALAMAGVRGSIRALDSDLAPAFAYVNQGRWIARCPEPDCSGAELVFILGDRLLCSSCANGRRMRPRPLEWPDASVLKAGVEQLLRRPIENRNWCPTPGAATASSGDLESVDDLGAENLRHGATTKLQAPSVAFELPLPLPLPVLGETPLLVTLDTNSVIYLIEGPPEQRSFMMEIYRMARKGLVELAVASRIEADLVADRDEARCERLLEQMGRLKHLALDLPSPMRLSFSRLGTDFLTDGHLGYWIGDLLFGGTSRGDFRDVDHLHAHIAARRHLFITANTSDFTSTRVATLARHGILVATPSKAAESLAIWQDTGHVFDLGA